MQCDKKDTIRKDMFTQGDCRTSSDIQAAGN